MQEKIWEQIIQQMTEEQVIQVLTDLGSAPPRTDGDNNLVFQSICHDSKSWKLCYYIDTHNFFCYRDWESFNIFSLVMKVKHCEFFEAFKYISQLLNLSTNNYLSKSQQGFASGYTKADWDLFDKFDKLQQSENIEEQQIEIYNPNILNLYYNWYYTGWIEEYISINSMKKYNIKYDAGNNRIIIPHYNKQKELIGIRCRNLSIEANAKYCPIYIENKLYSHPLSCNLYGINYNAETIQKIGKAMIVESEKSVMQCESYFPNNNFTLACCGSNISYEQIQLLLEMQVTEVILAMDWDFEVASNQNINYRLYKHKMLKLCQKLMPYFTVEVLLPFDNNFKYKCSPTDLGKDYLMQIMKNKKNITYEYICEQKEKEIEN